MAFRGALDLARDDRMRLERTGMGGIVHSNIEWAADNVECGSDRCKLSLALRVSGSAGHGVRRFRRRRRGAVTDAKCAGSWFSQNQLVSSGPARASLSMRPGQRRWGCVLGDHFQVRPLCLVAELFFMVIKVFLS